MLKVGLTGAHGVGKTTLCRELGRRLQAVGTRSMVTAEVPRDIVVEAGDPHFFRRANNTPVRQFAIIARQIAIEVAQNPSLDVLLCDRTLLDHWCYTVALFNDLGDAKGCSIWEGYVRRYLRTYEIICYVPIEFMVRDDGLREDDLAFQRTIDSLLRERLEAWAVAHQTVRGDLETRTSRCEELIQERLRSAR